MELNDILSCDFFKKLAALPFITKIVLYGSRARNDWQKRSDIDLAIDCPNATKADWQKVLNIIEEADTLLKIDCIRLNGLSNTNLLLTQIKNEGKVLYEQPKNEY